MSVTQIRDAVVAALRALGPGEAGDKAALKAAIGCTAAELDSAIDSLRFAGKIGFYGLVLSASLRADPEPEPVRADPVSPGEPPPASAEPACRAPGGQGAGPVRGYQEAAGRLKAHDPGALSAWPSGPELAAEILAYCARTGMAKTRFGKLCANDLGLVARLSRSSPRPRRAKRVRAFIAAHPDGLPEAAVTPVPAASGIEQPPAASALADTVREEAEASVARRRQAQGMRCARCRNHGHAITDTLAWSM